MLKKLAVIMTASAILMTGVPGVLPGVVQKAEAFSFSEPSFYKQGIALLQQGYVVKEVSPTLHTVSVNSDVTNIDIHFSEVFYMDDIIKVNGVQVPRYVDKNFALKPGENVFTIDHAAIRNGYTSQHVVKITRGFTPATNTDIDSVVINTSKGQLVGTKTDMGLWGPRYVVNMDPSITEFRVLTTQTSPTSIVKYEPYLKGDTNAQGKLITLTGNVGAYSICIEAPDGSARLFDVLVDKRVPVDTTPPAVTLTPSNSVPTNQSVPVSVAVSDAGAITAKKWAVGVKDKAFFANGGTTFTDSFLATENGSYTVYVKDAAGNETVQVVNITNIDKTPPAPATLVADNTVLTNKDVLVAITYPSDAVTTQYKINDGVWTPYTGAIVMPENGTVYAQSVDAVGNVSETATLVVSNIDKVAPIPATFTAAITVPTQSNVTVAIAYPSDAVTKQYQLNNGAWVDYTAPIVVTDNGTIATRSVDAVGNVSEVSTYTVSNIDRVAPESATFVVVQEPNEKPANPVTISSFKVDINLDLKLKDLLKHSAKVEIVFPSDASVKEYKIGEIGVWTAYTGALDVEKQDNLYARSKDAAGNLSVDAKFNYIKWKVDKVKDGLGDLFPHDNGNHYGHDGDEDNNDHDVRNPHNGN
jgi:hypothetical protein